MPRAKREHGNNKKKQHSTPEVMAGKVTAEKMTGEKVKDYRYESAKRKNNPPAKIAAEGVVPLLPKTEYLYSPRRPPKLQFDSTGAPDQLPELLAAARERALTDDEATTLATALRTYEPWLEWAGKREARRFEVDPVVLQIHERISAKAILKVAARQDIERSLFGDPEQAYHEAVQFYRHDIDWTNRLILGDSLQVMSSLARREDLAGKVQMIYIDPPYGIKFASNFQPKIGNRDVRDKEQDLTREPEMVKAYRDTWHLGIHSYLTYLRDRLVAARELLADTGSIFIQISDENEHRLRAVLDEVFDHRNFISLITFVKTGGFSNAAVKGICDYILWYAKDSDLIKVRQLHTIKGRDFERYDRVELSNGERGTLSAVGLESVDELPDGARQFTEDNATSQGNPVHPVTVDARVFEQPWKTNPVGIVRLNECNRLSPQKDKLRYIRYLDDFGAS